METKQFKDAWLVAKSLPEVNYKSHCKHCFTAGWEAGGKEGWLAGHADGFEEGYNHGFEDGEAEDGS